MKTLKYNPAKWQVPYNVQVFKDPKQILVTYALQVSQHVIHWFQNLILEPRSSCLPFSYIQYLNLVLLKPRKVRYWFSSTCRFKLTLLDYFRHFLGRLHRPQDFQFIVDGMTRILNQPMNTTSSYIPGNQSYAKCASEMIMLFWEITQCNKRFRSFLIDTDRSHDFVISIIFYSLEYRLDASKQGVVRMCIFILQTLSVEPNFGKNLNKRFEAQDTLPPSIRLQSFNGTYADFLIQVGFLQKLILQYWRRTVNLQHNNNKPRKTHSHIPCPIGSDK